MDKNKKKKVLVLGLFVIISMTVAMMSTTALPVVDLIVPANASQQRGSITVQCNASYGTEEAINISLWHNFDGTWSFRTVDTTPVNFTAEDFTVNTASFSDAASRIWNCYACNSTPTCASNSANYTVTLDNTAPTVVINSPSPQQAVTKSPASFKYTPTDTNINNCSVYIDGTAETADTTQTTGAQANHSYTYTINKVVKDYVTCYDVAGGSGTSASQSNPLYIDAGRIGGQQVTSSPSVSVPSSSPSGVMPISIQSDVTSWTQKISPTAWLIIVSAGLLALVFWKDLKKMFK